MTAALITGLAGTSLTSAEATFLKAVRPCGIILFARNCESLDGIRALVSDAREAIGADRLLVLIDQEGGRVQRLRPPLGRALPPAAAYVNAGALEAARSSARLVAEDLRDLGITMNCAPVLDVPSPGSHSIIGDRAYGATPASVAAFGRAVAEGLLSGGVLPVIKHIPGHGRATKDSHLDLPVVSASLDELEAVDFKPFRALRDLPAAMTAHVVFSAIDPSAPASTSAKVTETVIRGSIGFDGLLMSDDLSMKALTGSIRDRAEAVIRAGSDIALHCNGDLAEMQEAAAAVPELKGRALARYDASIRLLERRDSFDVAAAEAALAAVLASHTGQTESV
jgi:beta-N-acetylhexosaminidase